MTKLLNRYFHITERGSTIRRELGGGLATGLSMIYIVAVIPAVLATVGGMMAQGAVFTSVILITVAATLLMGLWANVPVAVSVGLGLNAYFAFVVCGSMGFDPKIALAAVLIEGVIFFLISVCGARDIIIRAIPAGLKTGIAVSIGVFIALIGLISGGVVAAHPSTIVSFADFTTPGPALLTFIGLAIIAALHAKKVPGGVIIAIILTTLIGIPMGVTVVPENFKIFSLPAAPNLLQFDFSQLLTVRFALVLITLLIANFFDTVGTLASVLSLSKLTDKEGNFPKIKQAYIADSLSAVIAAALGAPPATAYVESGVGAAAGARTGLANMATAAIFLAALFFSPLFLIMPASATAPALIFVGYLMMSQIAHVNFSDYAEGFAVYIGILACVFGYSITTGIIFSVLSYTAVKVCCGRAKEVPLGTYILAAFFFLQFFLPK